MPLPLLLPLALAATTLHCGAGVRAATPTLKAANGTRFTLRVATDDDHVLTGHGCRAEFTLAVQPPTGAPIENQPESSDGAWGRLIAIDLNGFDAQDTTAVGVLHEADTENPGEAMTSIFLVDLSAAQWASYNLDQPFRKKLTPECIAKLAIVGTTARYEVVVAASNAPNCPTTRFALTRARDKNQRDYIASIHALPKNAEVLPLDPGTAAP
jgi:hypothetical protein